MTEVATLSFNKQWPQWESRLIRSRNSQLVSAGFSSAVLFICSMWSCHLLIDTLLTQCGCVCLFSRTADHAHATFHTCRFHYVSRGDRETVSIGRLPGCIFPAERVLQAAACQGLVHVPPLSSAPMLFIHLVSLRIVFSSCAFLPKCRSVTHCSLEFLCFSSFLSAWAFVLYSVCLFVSTLYFSFSFQAPSNSEGYKINKAFNSNLWLTFSKSNASPLSILVSLDLFLTVETICGLKCVKILHGLYIYFTGLLQLFKPTVKLSDSCWSLQSRGVVSCSYCSFVTGDPEVKDRR